MKYIFDLDDVLFHTTRHRKEYIYPELKKLGLSIDAVDKYYNELRVQGKTYSLKALLRYFSLPEERYEALMSNINDYANTELIEILKKLGKENCYLFTFGDEELQLDKLKRTGIDVLVSEIIIIPVEEKKEILEKIAAKHKDEPVFFIDDKEKNFKNLDFKKCPNLKPILFTNTAQLRDDLPDLFRHK